MDPWWQVKTGLCCHETDGERWGEPDSDKSLWRSQALVTGPSLAVTVLPTSSTDVY